MSSSNSKIALLNIPSKSTNRYPKPTSSRSRWRFLYLIVAPLIGTIAFGTIGGWIGIVAALLIIW